MSSKIQTETAVGWGIETRYINNFCSTLLYSTGRAYRLCIRSRVRPAKVGVPQHEWSNPMLTIDIQLIKLWGSLSSQLQSIDFFFRSTEGILEQPRPGFGESSQDSGAACCCLCGMLDDHS